ncbi:hypothetical protein ACFQGW_04370 [Xanthomonas theicola]|uniref:hypothetical protein n=1 Tax=Xanthomonas theicola TaxID=56464 RepID=UPI00361F13CF
MPPRPRFRFCAAPRQALLRHLQQASERVVVIDAQARILAFDQTAEALWSLAQVLGVRSANGCRTVRGPASLPGACGPAQNVSAGCVARILGRRLWAEALPARQPANACTLLQERLYVASGHQPRRTPPTRRRPHITGRG